MTLPNEEGRGQRGTLPGLCPPPHCPAPGALPGRREAEDRMGREEAKCRPESCCDRCLASLVREGVKSERAVCRWSRFPERLAGKPSISNQSDLPVIICDQHQITPARHDPSSPRCDGPFYGCVYAGGGRGEGGGSGEEGAGAREWGGGHPPQWEPQPPRLLERRSRKLPGRGCAWQRAPPPPPAISLPSPCRLLRGELDWR